MTSRPPHDTMVRCRQNVDHDENLLSTISLDKDRLQISICPSDLVAVVWSTGS